MGDATRQAEKGEFTRREFVQAAATTGAGVVLGGSSLAQTPLVDLPVPSEPEEKVEEFAVGIIGSGSQGRNLLLQCLKIPGIRFIAVCDIWPYHQKYAANILKKYDQPVNVYEDYREMLAKESSLDAVIIATPDWMHAEQTVDCLKTGVHVYCEKEMANNLDGAKRMVLAARETGKLLQIGHQRRSNPRYWHALKLIKKDKVLGQICHVFGQWNRAQLYEFGWPKGKDLSTDALKRYGYDTMDRFRNWRWYRKYSGGAMADLGSHQVDVFNWFLEANPSTVQASGGLDFYQKEGREWYDNVMSIYEYKTVDGPVRGFYQVLNTTSHGGFFETFMGREGSMVISEDPRKGFLFREMTAKRREWEDEAEKVTTMGKDAIELKIGETLAPDGSKDPKGQALLEMSKKPAHLLHLENFFNAIRSGTPLTCPAELAYETAVSVLKANDAVESGTTLKFDSVEFKA